MWEIYSEGRTPFDNRSNLEVVNDITKGIRLYRPHRASQLLYAIMYRCWHEVPAHHRCINISKKTSSQFYSRLYNVNKFDNMCIVCRLTSSSSLLPPPPLLPPVVA